jgi:hypothetical protein
VFPKVLVSIVLLGAVLCALLALRQQRLQVASELTQAQLRINASDERLWILRGQIAARVSPDEIAQVLASLEPMRPIAEPPPPPPPAQDVTAPGPTRPTRQPQRGTSSGSQGRPREPR